MKRKAEVERKTKETDIKISLVIDGQGQTNITSGIPFFDHMLTLLAVHGFFDLSVRAAGDLDVDLHHTVEDVGLVLGDTIREALGQRKGIKRYGHAVTPMDDALAAVTIDLSNRPYLMLQCSRTRRFRDCANSLFDQGIFQSSCQPGRHESAY